MRGSVLLVVAWCACAHPAPEASAPSHDGPEALGHDETRLYTIWLGGARVGTATEVEMWTASGVTLRRTEALRFLRGDAPVAMTTTIEILADHALHPQRVTWTEDNGSTRRASAHHEDSGWIDDSMVSMAGAVMLPVDAAAVPAELVPLYVRRDGHFAGSIFLPARNFVGGKGRIDSVAPHRLVARFALDAGPIAEATIDLEGDGMPARVVDGEGVIAMRATDEQARMPFAPVDLIAATSVPIDPAVHPSTHHERIALVGNLALPPVPGQMAYTTGAGMEVDLSPSLPGGLPPGDAGPDRTGEISELVASVRGRIAPDLGARTATPEDVDAATAGDCTTFALAYAAVAMRAGIPTRVVTGLRVDGDRLARHRWAVSWTGRAWIAVDAAFGRVPAGGDLVGLAIHDADDAGLIAGEAALTQVRAAAWL
ncbi:MAG TPA: transglutaminase-like domain-containing protein [Kofleriaceae bacterium]